MSNVKKAYQPIVNLLTANQDARVGDILDDVIALAAAKTGGGGGKPTTFHKDAEGNVVAVQCYYFKKWFNPEFVPFGKKATSPTGLDRFTKAGLAAWNKSQSVLKKAKDEALAKLRANEIDADGVNAMITEAEEAAKTQADMPEEYIGFDTLEELLEHYGIDS